MRPSSSPQMMAAVLATVLALAPHTVSPQALEALSPAGSTVPATGISLVGTAPISTRLAPDTPGCPEMGLSGRLPQHQQVADWLPRQGGPKHQARPRLDNPVAVAQTLRPAMHMCVVDHFSPRDGSGTGKTVYRL
jgi:hypothetical protein